MKCPKCQTNNPETASFCADCGTNLTLSKDIKVTETLETPKEELSTGSIFAGRYQIIEELGKGGMGRVYKVLDKEVNTKIALKLIKPEISADKKTIERFRNELKTARDISHKNICRMYDLNKEEGSYYITMEFVPGEDLRSMIRMSGQLAVGTTINIAKQICEGLAEAHKLGVIHRDLKPGNILIDKEGNVRIMDFGIARSLEAKGITGAGVMIGTPEYMSPEQVEGKEVDQRSDIYSLGVILYEMVTGRVPFEGDTPFTIGMKHKGEMPKNPKELNTQISDNLNRLILRCLEKEKDKRYQSAGEVRSELTNIEKGIHAAEKVIPKRKPLTFLRISKEKRVRWQYRVLLYAVGFLVAGTLLLLMHFVRQPLSRWLGIAALPKQRHLAVLPFSVINESSSARDAFASGIAQSLTERLTQLTSSHPLTVAQSEDIRYYKVTDFESATVEMGSNLLLSGTVQADGEKLEVAIRLEDAGGTLRKERIEESADDPFVLEDSLLLSITDLLRLELTAAEKRMLMDYSTDVPVARKLYLQGLGYIQDSENIESLEMAISLFEEALTLDPRYGLGHVGRGRAYRLMSELKEDPSLPNEAIAACELALKLDDQLVQAHTCLGQIYRGMERYEEAARHFERATYLGSLDHNAWYGLARTYKSVRRIEDAERVYLDAIILRPHYWRSYYDLAILYSDQARYANAAQMLKKVVELAPTLPFAYSVLGASYAEQLQWSAAEEAFQKSLEIKVSLSAYNNLATSQFFQRQFREALKNFQKAIDYGRDNSLAWGNLGDAFYWAPGEQAKATAAYSKALEIGRKELQESPNNATLLGRMATWYAMTDKRDEALEYLDKAMDHSPNAVDVLLKAARVNDQLGNPDKAIDWLKRAINAGHSLQAVENDPIFDALRKHPNFRKISEQK